MHVKDALRSIYKRIGFHRSLRGELVLFFLIVLMVPLVGVSLLVLNQMQSALREQMANKLVAVRQLKAIQVEEYFQTVNRDVTFAARLPTTVAAVQEFGSGHDLYAIRRLGYLGNPDLVHSDKNDPYDVIHARYFDFFQNTIATKGYYDIYLISPNGDVVYNYDKGNDFATNLMTGPYRDTIVADLFRGLQGSANSSVVHLSDFVIYGPSGGAPASFAGAPIVKDGKNVGVLIYQLPVDRVNAVLEDRTGLGETGETYLVGADMLMRSDSRFQQDSSILKQEVNTQAVREALAGKSGETELVGYRGVTTFSAYQPIEIGSLKWALIAEVDPKEFFAPANKLTNVVLGIITVVSLIILSLGLLISNQIVRPIRALTVSAQQIGLGKLDAEIAEVGRQDEIGALARTFRQMQDALSAIYSNLEQRVAERTRDLNIASNLSRQITQELDTDNLLHLMVNQIKEGFNLYDAAVYLYQPQALELTLEASSNEGEKQTSKAVRVIGIDARPSLVAQTAREQNRAVINDVSQSDNYLFDPSLPDARSEAAFPMVVGTDLIGVLDLVSDKTDRFSESDIQILNTVAEQISIAVRNAQLYSVQVQAAAELRRAHEKLELYRFWFESSPDPIITYDTKGNVANANSAFEHVFGWTLDEIIGKRLDFVPEESLHTIKGLIETLYRDGKVVAADDGKRFTKDGRILDVQLSAALIKNNDGELSGNMSIFRDVTRQKQMEKRIADRTRDLNIASNVSRQITRVLDTDELLHQLVNQTKDGFNLYAASVYIYQQESKELTLEATTGEADRQMKKAVRVISLEARPSLVAQAARTQQQVVINDVSQSEDYLIDPSLPDAKAEAVFPMTVGTHVVGVLDLLSEKTDRFSETDIQILNSLAEQIGIAVRNAQLYSVQRQVSDELRRADKMKSQFLSSMSHELRTPLNAIINFVEMVSMGLVGEVTSEQKELLNLSLQSSNHLLNLINDILDISKIQAGKLTLFVEQNVNLYEELDTVIGVAAPMCKEKSIELELNIDRDLPLLSGDKRRIRQILLNLLSNAIKFTEKGTVTLSAQNKTSHILFSISDTGAGISPELQSIIFEPFVQTVDGVKMEQGTGLGLPISRSFAQAHGGNLWVESIVGKGSTFFFTLPVNNNESEENPAA
jgi:PAS domain S-box-containing protein